MSILAVCLSDVLAATRPSRFRFLGWVAKVVEALLGVVAYAVNQFFLSLGAAGGHVLAGDDYERLTLYIGDRPIVHARPSSEWPKDHNEGLSTPYAWFRRQLPGIHDFVNR